MSSTATDPTDVPLCVDLDGTLSYSLHFKRIAIADIFLLTFLYLSRIIGGILISDAIVSFWLFAFSFLLFLSLAAAKRCVELKPGADRGTWILAVAGLACVLLAHPLPS
jgi:4-hydroxybenzoate polyprenyltransferase